MSTPDDPGSLAAAFPWAAYYRAYYRDAYYCEAVLAVFRSKKAATSAVKLYASNCAGDEEVTLKRTADLSPDLFAEDSDDGDA